MARERTESRFARPDGVRPIQRFGLAVFGALLLVLFLVIAIAEGIGEPSVPAGEVALVQGLSGDAGHLSKEEFDGGLEAQVAGKGLKRTPRAGSKEYEELKAAVMAELIEGTWLRGEAEAMGITVNEKQVEAELANIKKQNFPTPKAYKEFLETSHFTQEDVDKKVELQILGTKVQERVNGEAEPASATEIQAYYDKEKSAQFTVRASRDVRLVINEDKAKVQAAKKALEEDSSSASWKKVATKYSSDPSTKASGGLQKEVTEEFVKGQLKKAIFGSPVGQLSGPLKYEAKFLLIEPVKVNSERVKPLAEVRSQISQTLSQQKQSQHFEAFTAGYRSTWSSRTFCAAGFEVEQCANFPASKRLEKSREPYKACYEANPKTPPKEGCPAPVEQTKPALPGTVSPITPRGIQQAQRPVPPQQSAQSSAP